MYVQSEVQDAQAIPHPGRFQSMLHLRLTKLRDALTISACQGVLTNYRNMTNVAAILSVNLLLSFPQYFVRGRTLTGIKG